MPFRRAIFSLFASLMFSVTATAAGPVRTVNGLAPGTSDLAITKAGPSSAAAGANVSYDVTVTNFGPDPAASVTLNDPIPAGLTFVSLTQNSGSTFSCNTPAPMNGTVTCTLANFGAGASANFTLVAAIPLMTPPGTSFTNIATVSSNTFDPNSENDSSSTSTTVSGGTQADLGVTKTGPSSSAANTDVAYTIAVTNSGPDAGQSVTLTDVLPMGLTFVSIVQNSGPTFTCMTPGVGTNGTVTCSLAMLPAGSNASFTLIAHVPITNSGTTYANTATISTTTTDPDSENDSGNTQVTVTDVDVSMTKSGPATVVAGQPITWTFTLASISSGAATNIAFSDTLPLGTTFVSFAQNTGPMATCSTPPAGGSGAVSCTLSTLNSGASASFTLIANVSPSVAAGTVLSNTASIDAIAGDSNSTNDSSTVMTTVTSSADLAVTKTGPATGTAGTNLSYTVTLTNNGPSSAGSVSLSDAVPTNATFVSEAQTSGPVFSCTNPAAGATGTTICTIASLAPGASAVFTIVDRAGSGSAGSTISNTASVTTSSTDGTPVNNSSTAMTTMSGSADVSVTKNAATSGAAGTNITYAIAVTNSGPSDAAAVTLTDVIPANTTFVSESQTAGPTFLCTTPAGGATGTVTCSIASLPAAGVANFTIIVMINPASPIGTSITNTATVTSTTTDPTPANNTASATSVVGTPSTADVTITKTASPGPFGTGRSLTYTITVGDAGPNAALNVVVTDVLPAGTTFVSVTPSQGTCSGTTTVTCSLGTVANAGTATISLIVTLPPTTGPVANTATVTSANVDPVMTNNTSTATVTVIPVAAIPTYSPAMFLLVGLAFGLVGFLVRK